MARFGFIAPKLKVLTFSDDVFNRIAQAGAISLSSSERELLGCLMNTAVHALQVGRASPTCGAVRTHLKRIAKKGHLDFTVSNVSDVNFVKARDLVLSALSQRHAVASCSEIKRAAASLRQVVPSGRGRSIDEIDLGLLWSFADLFEDIGGKPSAAWSEVRRDRKGPFVRFLRAIAAAMPEQIGRRFASGMEDRARRMLALRKGSGIRNNFAEIDFSPFRPAA